MATKGVLSLYPDVTNRPMAKYIQVGCNLLASPGAEATRLSQKSPLKGLKSGLSVRFMSVSGDSRCF